MLSLAHSRKALRLALLAALPLVARDAQAGELAYEASLGGGHTDNIERVAEDAVDETFASAGLRLSYDENNRRVDADVVADLDYYDYLDGDYESEWVGNLIGNSRVAIIEERLHWTLNDNFGQVLVDPFSPAGPENRENVNYLNTGLDATFGFGSQTRLNVGAAYAMATYEDSPLDSDTVVGEIAFMRLPSDSTSLGLTARVAEVDYSDSIQDDSDYDQTELFGQYRISGARTSLDAAVGYTEIGRNDGSSDSGPLFRLSLERLLTGMSTLRLNAGQEFANSASAFAAGQDGSVDLDTSAGRQNATPFKRQYLELGWHVAGRRTSLELSAGLQDQAYDNQPALDQTLTGYRLRLSRNLTAAFQLSLGLALEQAKFEQAGADYDDLIGNFGASWQMSRNLALLFNYNYMDREQDGFGGGYTENRFWLSLAYRQGEPRESLRRAFTDEGE